MSFDDEDTSANPLGGARAVIVGHLGGAICWAVIVAVAWGVFG